MTIEQKIEFILLRTKRAFERKDGASSPMVVKIQQLLSNFASGVALGDAAFVCLKS